MRQVSSVWRTEFDVDDIANAARRFSERSLGVLLEGKRRSAAEAAEYFSAFRAIDGPGQRSARPVVQLDEARVHRSLGYAARIVPLRMLKNGHTEARAVRSGMQLALGSADRIVADGSRETIIQAAREDPENPRWQRVTTSDEPCEFCAMLSARGGVYRTQADAEFEAHSGRGRACQCEPELVYGERWLSPKQQEWKQLYDRAAKGTPDPLKAFRAAYRAQT